MEKKASKRSWHTEGVNIYNRKYEVMFNTFYKKLFFGLITSSFIKPKVILSDMKDTSKDDSNQEKGQID